MSSSCSFRQFTHQHVLGQPAFILGDAGGDAEGEALLPQERVSSIATAEGHDLPGVWQVRYQHLVWVAGPRVDQRGWRDTRQMEMRGIVRVGENKVSDGGDEEKDRDDGTRG